MPQEQKDSGHFRGRIPVCRVCSQEPECLDWDLAPIEGRRVAGIVERLPPVDAGRHLFRVGDSLSAVFAVRRGGFKTYAFDGNGREVVLGFALPGELLGFDGVYARRHGAGAVALEESAVCALPYVDLATLMGKIERLREQVLRAASRGYGNHIFSARLAPDRLVARFLIDLDERSRSGRGDEFQLPMPMVDIAAFLRLEPGPLGEVLARLHRHGLIEIDGRTVRLLNPAGLREAALA